MIQDESTTKTGTESQNRQGYKFMMLSVMIAGAGLTGCVVNDPYATHDRTPVEVRRGETGGMQAPQHTRPVYGPDENFPAGQTQGGYSSDQQQESPFEESARELPQPVPAVARLVSQAESHISNEDYSAAAASAESALRLDPQSVQAYHTLARTYLFEKRFAESEQMALRAISILRGKGAGVGVETAQNLWLLIAQTRRERGDSEGAERAMQQAGGRY